MMTLNDPILGPSRGSPELALRQIKKPSATDKQYVAALWKWGGIAGVDPAIAFAWFCVETADGTSVRWRRDRNPAGLFIPADSTPQPFPIADGDEAARLQIQAFYALVKREYHPRIPIPAAAQPLMQGRWLERMRDPNFPRVRVLDDLDIRFRDQRGISQATWAWGHREGDPARLCVAKGNWIFRDLPPVVIEVPNVNTGGRLVFGRVERPEVELRDLVGTGLSEAWSDLGEPTYLGVCIHRMIGSLRGTDSYFRGAARRRALTHFGIGGPWDGTLDGVIYQWVPFGARAAPWANGPANHLEGDGVAFVRVLGVNAVNRDLRAIELSDGAQHLRPFGAVETPKQFRALVQLIAFQFDRQEVPWQLFPFNPRVGLVTYLEHWEFGPKECPFAPVRGQIEVIQDAVRAVMRAAQTGVASPAPVPRQPEQPRPVVPYSERADIAFLEARFGKMPKRLADGRVEQGQRGTKFYGFNPKGTISNLWLNRAMTEDVFPRAEEWMIRPETARADDPEQEIHFANGWTLLYFGDKQGWRWAGRSEGS